MEEQRRQPEEATLRAKTAEDRVEAAKAGAEGGSRGSGDKKRRRGWTSRRRGRQVSTRCGDNEWVTGAYHLVTRRIQESLRASFLPDSLVCVSDTRLMVETLTSKSSTATTAAL